MVQDQVVVFWIVKEAQKYEIFNSRFERRFWLFVVACCSGRD